jgi:hypothetical protein
MVQFGKEASQTRDYAAQRTLVRNDKRSAPLEKADKSFTAQEADAGGEVASLKSAEG